MQASDDKPPGRLKLDRQSLLADTFREYARRQHGAEVMSDAARAASIEATLREAPAPGPVWVFGYGSLLWNPAFHFVDQQTAMVHGYHRQFCLWTHLGRGSPENPGLMLGLEYGGCTRGVAYRVADEAVTTELDVIWRREMVTASYRPAWVRARTARGTIPAITFVINHAHPRYAGRLDEDTITRHVATAEGPLGPCCEYLFETVRHLAALDIHDRRLESLAARVRAHRERAG